VQPLFGRNYLAGFVPVGATFALDFSHSLTAVILN
jgi:hypothetical protein